jgi:hypothetical protein
VTGVEDSVQLSAAPAWQDIYPDVERGGDATERRQGNVIDVPTLDERDQGSRYSGTLRDVLLPQAAMEPNGPEGGADTQIVHRTTVPRRPSR